MDPFIYPSTTYYGVLCPIFVVKLSLMYDWLPDLKSHLLLCLSPEKYPFFAVTAGKTILLVFTFLFLPQLLLFLDPINIYRVHIAVLSQTLFPPKSQTTTPEAEDRGGSYPPLSRLYAPATDPETNVATSFQTDLTPSVPLARLHP